MGFFSDDRKMYIPLSIDTAEARRMNYFTSNKKMVEAVLGLAPYMFLMYPMLQGGVKLLPMFIVTAVYAVLYLYFIRFRILEESRLRKMVRELDKNRVSGVNHFWGINKIGNRGEDDGVIHYQREQKTTRGLVIAFDRGSTVGVQEGNFRRFRETKMEFLRELHLQKFNFQWYEMPKRSETPEALVNYFNIMTEVQNPYFKKLLKLQIDINTLFATDAEQRYVDYIVIRNSNFRTMRRFKTVVQGIIDTTLDTNGYILDPRILDKEDVERFFEDVLMIDSLDSNNIRKGVQPQPFEDFAKVQRIIRKDGRELPLEFMDDFDLTDYGSGKSIEDLIAQDEKGLQYKIKDIGRRKELELDRVRIQRNKDNITDMDYKRLQDEIKERFEKELEDLMERSRLGYVEEVEETEEVVPEVVGDEIVDVEKTVKIQTRREVVENILEIEEQELQDAKDEPDMTLEEMMRRNQK